MAKNLLPKVILDKYEVHEWKHACAVLKADFPKEWKDLTDLLKNFKFCKSWIFEGGGRKSKVIDHFLTW